MHPSPARPATPTRSLDSSPVASFGSTRRGAFGDGAAGIMASPPKKRPLERDRIMPDRLGGNDVAVGWETGSIGQSVKRKRSAQTNSTEFSHALGQEMHLQDHSPSSQGRPGPSTLFDMESGYATNSPNRAPASLLHSWSPERKRAKRSAVNLDSPTHSAYSTSPMRPQTQSLLQSPRRETRTLAKVPFKVLDAPDLADDFYLNLVDWSSTNTLGVGLGSCVYLWSAQTSKVHKLCDLSSSQDVVTSINWVEQGTTLAVGTQKGSVEIWDAEKLKKVRTMSGHTLRVGTLAWNNAILTSGSRDYHIFHRDVRVAAPWTTRLSTHKQEVCGLKWNKSINQLASGGNDNRLFIWEGTNTQPLFRFTDHQAAVKAIAWSPHQRGILASGGGTADKKIRFWNTLTDGNPRSQIDTGSQVCNLLWSKNSNEVVSTHGFAGPSTSNHISIWKYPSLEPVGALTGHTCRVLYLAMSPDGQTIVTGAGDETLRFWSAFPKAQQKEMGESPVLNLQSGLR